MEDTKEKKILGTLEVELNLTLKCWLRAYLNQYKPYTGPMEMT